MGLYQTNYYLLYILGIIYLTNNIPMNWLQQYNLKSFYLKSFYLKLQQRSEFS